jgi:hypothetical protein
MVFQGAQRMSLEALFCDVDDFCQSFLPHWQHEQLAYGECRRRRPGHLSLSEIMTIVVHFHQSHYRHFKGYYLSYVRYHLKRAFPG